MCDKERMNAPYRVLGMYDPAAKKQQGSAKTVEELPSRTELNASWQKLPAKLLKH
jgi:hypothetical protein